MGLFHQVSGYSVTALVIVQNDDDGCFLDAEYPKHQRGHLALTTVSSGVIFSSLGLCTATSHCVLILDLTSLWLCGSPLAEVLL